MGDVPVYALFGVRLESGFPFTNALHAGTGPTDLRFEVSENAPDASRRFSGRTPDLEVGRLPDGQPFMTFTRGERHDRIEYTEVAAFYLSDRTIACHVLDHRYAFAIEIYLLGQVMAYWLLRFRGLHTLHAAAVEVGGRAVGFMATNKGGKTSLAAEMMRAGCALVTDDVLPVEPAPEGVLAHSGYPQMRMWPDQAAHFHGRYVDLPLVHPDLSKRRVPVGQDGLGSFVIGPRPLACLYVPERRDSSHGDTITITRAAFADAVLALRRNHFLGRALDAFGAEDRWFELLTRLAADVPVRTLTYPTGVEHLPGVRDAVLADVAEVTAAASQASA